MSVENSGWLRHVIACNSDINEPFLPWLMDGLVVGWLRPGFAAQLIDQEEIFRVEETRVGLNERYRGFDQRSAALGKVTRRLHEEGLLPHLMNEPYPVTAAGREQAKCVIDRAASAWFGVRAFGQHVNAVVRDRDQLMMWIARRSMDRLIFPGYLDNMVAGGLPYGLDFTENLVKEGEEEANAPAELMRRARPVSAITYNRITGRGLRPDTLYCYDMELSPDFVPQNTDGEVDEFLLLPVPEVMRLVRETDEFKLNCNLVLLDFFIRHGYLGPEDPEYLDVMIGLRQPLGLNGKRI